MLSLRKLLVAALALCLALLPASPALAWFPHGVAAGGGGGGGTSVFKDYTNFEFDGTAHLGQAFNHTGVVAGDIMTCVLAISHTTDSVAGPGPPTLDGSTFAMTQVATDVWAANSGVGAVRSYLFYKVLDASDLSSGTMSVPSYGGFDGYNYSCAIFHGGTTVTKKDFQTSASGTSTQLVFNGYAQSGGTSVVMTHTRINQGNGGDVIPPSPFTDFQDIQASGYGVTSSFTVYGSSAGAGNLTATTYTFDGYDAVVPSSGSHAGQGGYLFQIS